MSITRKQVKLTDKVNPIFTTRTDIVQSFLKDINKYEILNVDDELEVLERIKNGDLKARNELIEKNQRIVFALAKNYTHVGSGILDLVNEANIGFMEAIDTFDITRGNRFNTYAIWHMRRAINAYVMNDDKIIKKSNYRKTAYKVNKIKNKFFSENGRYPNEDEIIAILKEKYNMDIKCYDDMYDLVTKSINMTFNDDDKHAFENTHLFQSKTIVDNDVDDVFDNEYTSNIIKKAMNSLSSRECEIIKMCFGIGYDYEMTIDDIAEHFGICTERVRQIKKTALRKMQKCMPQMVNKF